MDRSEYMVLHLKSGNTRIFIKKDAIITYHEIYNGIGSMIDLINGRSHEVYEEPKEIYDALFH